MQNYTIRELINLAHQHNMQIPLKISKAELIDMLEQRMYPERAPISPTALLNYKNTFLPTLYQNLDYLTLTQLCQTSKEYYRICSDPATWIYLLKRDYNVTWDPQIKNYSHRAFYELNYLFLDNEDFKSLILNKIKQLSQTSPKDPKVYILTHEDSFEGSYDVNKIVGRNIYEILYKYLKHYPGAYSNLKVGNFDLPVNIRFQLYILNDNKGISRENLEYLKNVSIGSSVSEYEDELIEEINEEDIKAAETISSQRFHFAIGTLIPSFNDYIDTLIEHITNDDSDNEIKLYDLDHIQPIDANYQAPIRSDDD